MNRIERAQHLLKNKGLDMYVSQDLIEIEYIFGVKVSAGCMLITPKKVQLFVDHRYIETLKKKKGLDVSLGKPNLSGTVGFDGARTVYNDAVQFKQKGVKLISAPIISKTREVKDSKELKIIKKAADLVKEAMVFAINSLQLEMTEIDLKQTIEMFYQNAGAECSFEPIIAFGNNSAYPHHHSSSRKLKVGDIVLIDMGAKVKGYCSDMTRTFMYKKSKKKVEEMYQRVVLAHDAAVLKIASGTSVGDLDKEARKSLGELEQYFVHSLGHGIGIEVHESPFLKKGSKDSLQSGMVITIEPGVYDPSWGGIRHENMFVVQDKKYQNLTEISLPFVID